MAKSKTHWAGIEADRIEEEGPGRAGVESGDEAGASGPIRLRSRWPGLRLGHDIQFIGHVAFAPPDRRDWLTSAPGYGGDFWIEGEFGGGESAATT